MTVSLHWWKGLFPTVSPSHPQFWNISLLELCKLTILAIGFVVVSLFLQTFNLALLLLLVVLMGLMFNTQTMLLGEFLGIGPQLERLNRWRFLMHSLCVPLLMIVAVDIAHHAHMPWMHLPWVRYGVWAIALSVGLLSFMRDYSRLSLQPETVEGLLLYRSTAVAIPVPAILTSLSLIVLGISLWVQADWPWIFCTAMLSFVANAAPTELIGRSLGTAIELGLMIVLVQAVLQFSL